MAMGALAQQWGAGVGGPVATGTPGSRLQHSAVTPRDEASGAVERGQVATEGWGLPRA